MKLLLSLFCLLVLANCNKIKENLQEDLAIKAMTDGQWRVSKFNKAGVDKTTEFSTYLFQFHQNNTVDAINNGAKEKTGNWQADPTNRTISSTFTNAASTIMLLNGTWKISKNGWTYVEADQTVNGETFLLRLDK